MSYYIILLPYLLIFLACSTVIIFYRILPKDNSLRAWKNFFYFDRTDMLNLLLMAIAMLLVLLPVYCRLPETAAEANVFAPDLALHIEMAVFYIKNNYTWLAVPETAGIAKIASFDFRYGAIFLNIIVATGVLLKKLSITPDFALILKLWLLYTGFFLFSLQTLIYFTAKNLTGKKIAGIASGIILLTPFTTYFLTIISAASPDLLQQCFITLTIIAMSFLGMEFSWRALFVASLGAGLIFGTKYSGAFFIPLIVLSALQGNNFFPLAFPSIDWWLKSFAIGTFGSILGLIIANPQALQIPTFIEKLLSMAGKVSYPDSYFNAGVIKTYYQLFKTFINNDAILIGLIIGGLAFLLLCSIRQQKFVSTLATYLLLWLLLYIILLLTYIKYPVPGIFFPVWSVLSIGCGCIFGLIPAPCSNRKKYAAIRAIISCLSLVALAIFIRYEVTSTSSAFYPTKVTAQQTFNLKHDLYRPANKLAEFLKNSYSPEQCIIYDYSQIYIPETFNKAVNASFVQLHQYKPHDLSTIFVLTRTDSQFEYDLKAGYYDKDVLAAAQAMYNDIRSSGQYTLVYSEDYMPGWFAGPVEVWEPCVISQHTQAQFTFEEDESVRFMESPNDLSAALAPDNVIKLHGGIDSSLVYAAAYPGQHTTQQLVFTSKTPINKINFTLYSNTLFANRIVFEKQHQEKWETIPLAQILFSGLNCQVTLSSPIVSGEKFRISFSEFHGQERILLKKLVFENDHKIRFSEGMAANGEIIISDYLNKAILQPSWYSYTQKASVFAANAPPDGNIDKRNKKLLIKDILELPHSNDLLWKKVSESIVPSPDFTKHTIKNYKLLTGMQTELDVWEAVPPKISYVIIYAPGTWESGFEGLAQAITDVPWINESIVISPTLAHAAPGVDINFFTINPRYELVPQNPLGIMTAELGTAIKYASDTYPDKPIIVAGYSLGAQVALLAASVYETSATILFMPGFGLAEIYDMIAAGSNFAIYELPSAASDIFLDALIATDSPVYMLTNIESTLLTQICSIVHGKGLKITSDPHGPFQKKWLKSIPQTFIDAVLPINN